MCCVVIRRKHANTFTNALYPRNQANVMMCVAHRVHGCEGEVVPLDAHPGPREDGHPVAAPAVTPLQLPQIRGVQRVRLPAHSTNLALQYLPLKICLQKYVVFSYL